MNLFPLPNNFSIDSYEIKVSANGRIYCSFQGKVVEIATAYKPPPPLPPTTRPNPVVEVGTGSPRFLLELAIGVSLAAAIALIVSKVFL